MEAGRMVHPAVDRDHRQRPGDAGNRDGDAASEMGSRGEPAPAVNVDPEADKRDVHHKGERLHLPGLQQIVLVDPSRDGARQYRELAHLLSLLLLVSLPWLDRARISLILPGL